MHTTRCQTGSAHLAQHLNLALQAVVARSVARLVHYLGEKHSRQWKRFIACLPLAQQPLLLTHLDRHWVSGTLVPALLHNGKACSDRIQCGFTCALPGKVSALALKASLTSNAHSLADLIALQELLHASCNPCKTPMQRPWQRQGPRCAANRAATALQCLHCACAQLPAETPC